MPTKNPRVNITFDPSVTKVLAQLALQENRSVASMANELVLEALERREDVALSDIAALRDKPKTKRYKHSDAWK